MKTFRLTASIIIMLASWTFACRSSSPVTATPETIPPAESSISQPEIHSNTIKWSTASEVDNFGYDVYRGDGPDGPFERLTKEPVEGAGTSDEVHKYSFVDETIDPTKAYYYYVESISMSGDRELFTPIGKAKAKIEQATDPATVEPE